MEARRKLLSTMKDIALQREQVRAVTERLLFRALELRVSRWLECTPATDSHAVMPQTGIDSVSSGLGFAEVQQASRTHEQ